MSAPGPVHVVGAGLAGLSAAVRLVEAGQAVHLYDAAPQPGGRCRTFHDPRLGRDVDNGNHLVLSGNRRTLAYLATIGASGRMVQGEARFPFADLATGDRWTVRLNRGPVPWWVATPSRRVAGTSLGAYLAGWRLPLANAHSTVAEAVRDRGPLWSRFWEPVTWAVLNTTPERGSARLLWRVLSETFLKGADHARPMFAPQGLGRALVDPAVGWLAARGARLATGTALRALEVAKGRVTALRFAGHDLAIERGARVILALPPTRLRAVLPGQTLPPDDAGIVNAHFTVPGLAADLPPFMGIVGAETHWIFVRGDVVSLTISAADRLGAMDADPEVLIPRLWSEVQRALGHQGQFAAARINKERRATFDQSPAGVALRPGPKTTLTNLFLAGDATDTGLPATIEGAIRSGEEAARLTRY